METFQIKRADNPDLIFEGELLAKVGTPRHRMPDGERGYELGLYTKAGGGFVVSVEYLTTVDTEKNSPSSDVVDDLKDVENFFLVVEPCEYVDREMLDALSTDQRSQFRKAMCAIYDGHVDAMLNALQGHQATRKDDVSSKSSETKENPPPKKGMLSFLGLK